MTNCSHFELSASPQSSRQADTRNGFANRLILSFRSSPILTISREGGMRSMMLSNATDLSLYLSPAWIHEPATGAIRGQLRGLWGLCAPGNSLPDGMTFSGTGAFAGKTFYFVKNMSDATCVVMETSNTLLTN